MKLSPLTIFLILVITGLFFHFIPNMVDSPQPPHAEVKEITTLDEMTHVISQSTRPIVALLSTPTCAFCLRVIPFFNDAADMVSDQAQFIKVLLTDDPRIAEQYQVHTVPTLIMFDANHQPMFVLRNSRDISAFLRKLAKYNPAHRSKTPFITYARDNAARYQAQS